MIDPTLEIYKNVYPAHPMEGYASFDESIEPCLELERELGPGYNCHIAERFQVHYCKQQTEDLKHVRECGIIVADCRRIGDIVEGKCITGKGTNREIGIVQGMNYANAKCGVLRPIILVLRKNRRRHCFDLEGSPRDFKVTKVVFSMKEAAQYIKSKKWRNWK